MSSRPSNIIRQQCEANKTSVGRNIVIIGDTALAVIYAYRLVNNQIGLPIIILTEGSNNMNQSAIYDTTYSVTRTRTMLNNLQSEKIHLIPDGDNDHVDDNNPTPFYKQVDEVYQLYTGFGVLGDFISMYIIPRAGPWLSEKTSNRYNNFVREHTKTFCLSSAEKQLVETFKTGFNIAPTSNSFTVKKPSILTMEHTFVTDGSEGNDYFRQLFENIYHYVQDNGAVIYTEVTGLLFSPSASDPALVDINFSANGKPFTILDCVLSWRTNIYTYLRLASEGGLTVRDQWVPVQYRAVVSIPKINGDTGVTVPDQNIGDLVTTSTSFSLNDLSRNHQSALNWLIQCYTSVEDTSTVSSAKYAASGRTLLIVEALNTQNRRRCNYATGTAEVQMYYNSRKAESKWFYKFAEIVAKIIQAYTGVVVNPASLLPFSDTCSSTTGICTENNQLTDTFHRITPMETLINIGSHLYHASEMPVPDACD